jgi:hypothetical protein
MRLSPVFFALEGLVYEVLKFLLFLLSQFSSFAEPATLFLLQLDLSDLLDFVFDRPQLP